MNNKNYEMPLGLVMALSSNEQAMDKYSALTSKQKLEIKNKAMQATSKSEMQRIVQNIADGEFS
ncbi:MAG: hypothetical protein U0M12_04460 [Acutalibacteraceae bacterium]|nr:hypothetical protein [Acutalibacteraceae bacterium]